MIQSTQHQLNIAPRQQVVTMGRTSGLFHIAHRIGGYPSPFLAGSLEKRSQQLHIPKHRSSFDGFKPLVSPFGYQVRANVCEARMGRELSQDGIQALALPIAASPLGAFLVNEAGYSLREGCVSAGFALPNLSFTICGPLHSIAPSSESAAIPFALDGDLGAVAGGSLLDACQLGKRLGKNWGVRCKKLTEQEGNSRQW